MAFIKEMSYSRQSSVKIAEYQYEKPTVSMTAVLEEGDDYDKVMKDLRKEVDKALKRIEEDLQE